MKIGFTINSAAFISAAANVSSFAFIGAWIVNGADQASPACHLYPANSSRDRSPPYSLEIKGCAVYGLVMEKNAIIIADSRMGGKL